MYTKKVWTEIKINLQNLYDLELVACHQIDFSLTYGKHLVSKKILWDSTDKNE